MKLTEDEMQNRRKKIILTAFHLFCERGIEDVLIKDIAKEAKVGDATIYRYFECKTNLVLDAFVKLWDMIMSQLKENVESSLNYHSMNGYEQIKVWMDSYRQLYQNHADFVLFSYEAKLYLLRHKVKLDQSHQDIMMHSIKEPCLLALEKGKMDGSTPFTGDTEDVFYSIWGAIRGYIGKIVIYDKLYGDNSPWESRYEIMEQGILVALQSGWKMTESQLE